MHGCLTIVSSPPPIAYLVHKLLEIKVCKMHGGDRILENDSFPERLQQTMITEFS